MNDEHKLEVVRSKQRIQFKVNDFKRAEQFGTAKITVMPPK